MFLFLRSHFATTAFVQNTRLELTYQRYLTEVESSRKSLASRTYFEVPGIGLKDQAPSLEAYKFLKMPCPQPRTALFFESLKMGHGSGGLRKEGAPVQIKWGALFFTHYFNMFYLHLQLSATMHFINNKTRRPMQLQP